MTSYSEELLRSVTLIEACDLGAGCGPPAPAGLSSRKRSAARGRGPAAARSAARCSIEGRAHLVTVILLIGSCRSAHRLPLLAVPPAIVTLGGLQRTASLPDFLTTGPPPRPAPATGGRGANALAALLLDLDSRTSADE